MTETGDRMALVEQAIEDYIAGKERLPSTTDIVDSVELSDHQVRRALNLLEKNGRIIPAYRAERNPTIYVPKQMFEALLHYKQTPSWLDEYGLDQRKKVQGDIQDQEDKLNRLRRLEELLYTSGRTLEVAIYTALSLIEVPQLNADFEDADMWDFSFFLDGMTYIADAKGKSKGADKGDVGQLENWLKKYLDENEDADPESLCGLLIINHYRDVEPPKRWPEDDSKPPLTAAGDRYLRLGGCRRFVTTLDLFEIVQKVVDGELSTEEARAELAQRMKGSVGDD